MSPGDAHPWFFEGLLEMGEAVVLFDGHDEAGDRDSGSGSSSKSTSSAAISALFDLGDQSKSRL